MVQPPRHRVAGISAPAVLALACLCNVVSCSRSPDAAEPAIAVTNGLLAAAVRDLLGSDQPVLTLAEPGMCPGHFDVRPSQVRQLRACRLVLRFDFQGAIDRQVGDGGPRIVEIKPDAGLCVPATYLSICRQTADALVAIGLLSAGDRESRLREIGAQVDALARDVRAQIDAAGLRGRPVVASDHQAAFCKFLGLDVVGTLSTADRMTIADISRTLNDGTPATIVVANLPEGTDLADAIASRLGARLAVFGNFPEPGPSGERFDALVRENVRRLIKAAQQ